MTNQTMHSLSVIIPNYNGRHLLEAYLPSVITALQQSGSVYEIIIVDDCSKDGSITFLEEHYPGILLQANPENKGFSYTCNKGIAIARYELCLLLNSDVKLDPDYFSHQFAYFDKDDTFGVMGRIMSADGSRIEDAARILFYQGCRLKANRFYYSTAPGDDQVYTAYLSGANALISTKKLRELGGFDEIYSPFSSEDSDLSTRAWLLGWKCYYEHRSVCYHQVSGSTKTQIKSDFIKKIYYRNRFVFHRIHLEGFRAFIWPFYLLLLEVLPKLLSGNFWVLESYTDYLKLGDAVKSSKSLFKSMKQKYHSNLRISDIMNTINMSISSKSIKRL
ncbi:glycosyltransferase family 2 protein [Pedobacter sp. JY14-1]|uniref:glycosyltransferase family 2 protein n=1 Tax=Pedobacter sp. JY14-1 TaxID=3034151 RepID=UPI0023E21D09|nr:glycosyltransferase family 2 protein [Pedobacter sp. JY14-1]